MTFRGGIDPMGISNIKSEPKGDFGMSVNSKTKLSLLGVVVFLLLSFIYPLRLVFHECFFDYPVSAISPCNFGRDLQGYIIETIVLKPWLILGPFSAAIISLICYVRLRKDNPSPVKIKSPIERTSVEQLRWLLGILKSFLLGIINHFFKKFGYIYGILSGIIITVLLLAAFTWYAVLDFPAPWKIIDPSNPSFNPAKFDFEDYNSRTLGHALACIFPRGTSKSEVDKILIEIGHAKVKEDKKSAGVYYYSYNLFRDELGQIMSPIPHSNLPATIYFPITYDSNLQIRDAGFLKNTCNKEK